MADKPQNDIYSTLSKLREKYSDSDDIERIDSEFKRVRALLTAKGLAENEAIKELIAVSRAEIIYAKKKLATDKTLVGNEKAQLEFWFIIEAREWFLKLVTKDFDSELESLSAELEAELER